MFPYLGDTYRKLANQLFRSCLGVVFDRMIHQSLSANSSLDHRDPKVTIVLVSQLGIIQSTLESEIDSLFSQHGADKLHIESVFKAPVGMDNLRGKTFVGPPFEIGGTITVDYLRQLTRVVITA